jgi:hypothetical protein
MVLNVLLKPGFFASPDRYYGKNYKSCTYEGIPFEQAGYDLQRRESHTDSKGNTYYTYETYAKGTMYRFAIRTELRRHRQGPREKRNPFFRKGQPQEGRNRIHRLQ